MRFANVGGRATLVVNGFAVDLSEASGGLFDADPQAAFGRWSELRAWADGRTLSGPRVDAELLLAPVPSPRQVFAIGMNYATHAAEASVEPPGAPVTFTKYPSCLTGPQATVRLSGRTVDWEAELVVVIGQDGYRVPERDAWQHVAGLAVGQDLSDRSVQMRPPTPQFSLGKSFPGYGPIGPWVVTPDDLADPSDLAIACELNGEQVQQARTSEMIFDVPALIAHISAVTPLLAGDLIFTGTPSGIGGARTPPRFLAPGDALVTTIEGIGTLETRFIDNAAF